MKTAYNRYDYMDIICIFNNIFKFLLQVSKYEGIICLQRIHSFDKISLLMEIK